MSRTIFYVVLNVITADGYESIGSFCIGNDRETAHAIFNKLKGNNQVDEKSILQLDLIESIDSLPVNLKIIGCTLEELAENCKIITKDVFKQLNLEEW